MENLLLPSKIDFQEGDTPYKGTVSISPCYYGYGTTLGNALRRVLLSSLPGAAVEAFKIMGVQHEFTTVDGIKEDVVEIMLNLKQLIVKVHADEPVVLSLNKKGVGIVTAADFDKNSSVEIINQDQVICTLTNDKPFELEITVGRGRGFKTTEEKDRSGYDLGTIVVDSIYTPIRDVGYSVEYTRVGDVTNFEKLILSIETNGTVTPRQAVLEATQILMDHFTILFDEAKVTSFDNKSKKGKKEDEAEEDMKKDEQEEGGQGEPEEETEDKPKAKKKATKKKTK